MINGKALSSFVEVLDRSDKLNESFLLDLLPIGICICDAEGVVKSSNPKAQELWGRVPVENSERFCGSYNLYDQDCKPLAKEGSPVAHCLRDGIPRENIELIIGKPDSTFIDVRMSVVPIFDDISNLIGVISCITDVSELKAAERSLRQSEELFKIAANTAPVLVWMADAIGKRFFFNTCWLDFTGKSLDEAIGDGWMDCIHPSDLSFVHNVWRVNFEAEREYKMQYRLLRNDGVYRWVYSHGIPRYAADGSFAGYIGTILDIHDQKMRKEELKKNVSERTEQLKIANEKLERSNKELEQFAYVASHDLQEPLRKIKALGSLLIGRYEAKLGDAGLDIIHRMQSASARMTILIDDLLSYSQISSEQQKQRVDLSVELAGVLTDLDTLIKETGAQIKIGTLYPVNGYALQIRQLFQNLLGNAIKFSRPGEPVLITISARLVKGNETDFQLPADEGEKQFQLIEVSDNGIGFEQHQSNRIFQVFQRLHGKDKYAGTGVGLSIVQKVMETHNGYIKAHGNPGKGATFQLLLPLKS